MTKNSFIKASPQEFIDYMKSLNKCKISKEEARKVLFEAGLITKTGKPFNFSKHWLGVGPQ